MQKHLFTERATAHCHRPICDYDMLVTCLYTVVREMPKRRDTRLMLPPVSSHVFLIKMETSSQEDIEPEESIYSGGFTSAKDQALFPKFHNSGWKEKFALLDKFEDERLITFGHGLIFNEAPEILPKEIHKKIKRRIASRILSTNKEKWWTVSAFYSECDEIRENEDKMFSFKTVDEKLKFLDVINEYVMNLEQKYSDA